MVAPLAHKPGRPSSTGATPESLGASFMQQPSTSSAYLLPGSIGPPTLARHTKYLPHCCGGNELHDSQPTPADDDQPALIPREMIDRTDWGMVPIKVLANARHSWPLTIEQRPQPRPHQNPLGQLLHGCLCSGISRLRSARRYRGS